MGTAAPAGGIGISQQSGTAVNFAVWACTATYPADFPEGRLGPVYDKPTSRPVAEQSVNTATSGRIDSRAEYEEFRKGDFTGLIDSPGRV